ncbi:MAG: VOC family protein [Rhodospirillaceae bacterium]|nr:VOC family protein [Rhodospirillaceae bacterium]
MNVTPYLFFDGRCEEALTFYQQALGARLGTMMRFKDSPEPQPEGCVGPGSADKIMHAEFNIAGTDLMASDGMNTGKPSFAGISLALNAPDKATVDTYFNALAEGGQVQMPLGATFFAERFGVVADRFGVSWMIISPNPM